MGYGGFAKPVKSDRSKIVDVTDDVTDMVHDPATNKGKKRLLVLTHRVPYPPDRGDRIRSYHLLKTVSRHFRVSLACTSQEPVGEEQRRALRAWTEALAVLMIKPTASAVRAAGAVARGRAFTAAYYFRPRLARTIVAWHAEEPFDAVLTFCTGMIGYARLLTGERGGTGVGGDRVLRPRHVLDLVDVDSVKWRSYAGMSRLPVRWLYEMEARRLSRIEGCVEDHVDAVTVVSPEELRTYREHVAGSVVPTVVGNGVDLDYFRPAADTTSKLLVFVGVLNYKPNVDGLCWFVQRVWPGLRQRHEGVRLRIVGRDPSPIVLRLGRVAGVEVVGPVDDVRSHLAAAAVVVAPLRLARGVQNKVLEAMACAKPVVCSPAAARGIEAEAGEHFWVADGPGQWAAVLSRLLEEPALRRRIGTEARRCVEQRYRWERRLEPMVRLLRGEPVDGVDGSRGWERTAA